MNSVQTIQAIQEMLDKSKLEKKSVLRIITPVDGKYESFDVAYLNGVLLSDEEKKEVEALMAKDIDNYFDF